MFISRGNTNTVYEDGDKGYRVPHTKTDLVKTCAYWNEFWKPKLGEYMGPMAVAHHKTLGACLEIEIHGSSFKNKQKLLEFKPKWLHQSKNAPFNALSCRTCAVRLKRNQPFKFCSLDLANFRFDDLFKQIDKIHHEPVEKILIPLIAKLKKIQLELDTLPTLCDCMSIRDCSCIVELDLTTNSYKVFVVDLDIKSPLKIPHWNEIEENINYLAVTNCRLSR